MSMLFLHRASPRAGRRRKASVYVRNFSISLVAFLTIVFWNSSAHAAIECKDIQSELQQIHALLGALESSDGNAQGHFAVATGIMRRFQAVSRRADDSRITGLVNSTTQSIRGFLAALAPDRLASRGERGYSKERLQLAATVRNAVNGLKCSSPNDANSALNHERDPMAEKLLEADAEAAAKGERGAWSGYNPKHISLALTKWSGKSELEVYVAIIIISCLLALAIGELIERRRQKRFVTRLPASVHYGSQISEITVFDISSGGARLSALPGVKPGERIALVLGDHRFQAQIRWQGQKCFGVKFDQRLDRFALMRLRGV
ncbi:MAG: PilZ domain-containing protein [Pseudomonadota bacterium]